MQMQGQPHCVNLKKLTKKCKISNKIETNDEFGDFSLSLCFNQRYTAKNIKSALNKERLVGNIYGFCFFFSPGVKLENVRHE